MKQKSSGFKRGFLLRGRKTRRNSNGSHQGKSAKARSAELRRDCTKRSSSSSVLLDVEKQARPTLLVVDESAGEDHLPAESYGRCPSSTGRSQSRPLIQEILNEGSIDEDGQCNLEPNTDEASSCLIDEESLGDSEADDAPFLMEAVESRPMKRDLVTTATFGEPDGPNTAMSSIDDIPANHTDPSSANSGEQFDPQGRALLFRHLSRIKWELKRSRSMDVDQESKTLLMLCGTQRPNWMIVWESMLQDVGANQNPSVVSLGVALVRNEPTEEVAIDTLVTFLDVGNTLDDKSGRLKALGVANLVRATMSLLHGFSEIPSRDWRCRVGPRLADLVVGSGGDRSLLLQTCMTAAYDILAATAHAIAERHAVNDALSDELERSLPWLESLWNVQERWIRGASTGRGDTEGQSRKQCVLAVLDDWRKLLAQIKRGYDECRIRKPSGVHLTHAAITTTLYLQLTGAGIEGVRDDAFVGGLQQTLSHEPYKLSVDEIMSCLARAESNLQAMRGNTDIDQVEDLNDQLHMIVRGVAAWLGQSKRHLRGILAFTPSSESSLKGAIGLCLSLLRSKSRETAELILILLNRLWATSGGVPPDVIERSSSSAADLPCSFTSLLEQLEELSDESRSVDRALCVVVSRCIQVGGPSLLQALVSRNGLQVSSVEIIAMLVLQQDSFTAVDGDLAEQNESQVSQMAGDVLLHAISQSEVVQKKALSTPALFSGLPPEATVPKLVSALAALLHREAGTSLVGRSAVTVCLTDIMVRQAQSDSAKFMRTVTAALVALPDYCSSSHQNDKREENGTIIDRVCQAFSGAWRRALWQPSTSVDLWGSLVVALGKEMGGNSNEIICMKLLGCLLGDTSTIERKHDDDVAKRIFFMVKGSIGMATRELENAQSQSREAVCARLVPLAFLRRIPAVYYHVAWSLDSRDKLVRRMTSLADQLTLRLDICENAKKFAFTPIERKFSSEIAGIALPFNGSDRCSCFHRFCVPAFSNLINALGQDKTKNKESVRVAKAALFSTCQYLQVAESGGTGEGLVEVSWFVIHVLSRRTLHEATEDIDQLCDVCVNFLALCMCLPFVLSTTRRETKPLVPSVSDITGVPQKTPEKPLTVRRAMARINSAVCSLLRTGEPPHDWLQSTGNPFGIKPSTGGLSLEGAICLWNAVLSVSTRFPIENGQLLEWANATAPWVLNWGAKASVDQSSVIFHPGCVAAALQVVFGLITRTGRTSCLSGGESSGRTLVLASVHRAHSWGLASIQYREPSPSYSSSLLRLGGLKLLLALVTFDSSVRASEGDPMDLVECLSPGEMRQTLLAVQGAANLDPDPEFRSLAVRFLETLQSSSSP